MIVHSFRRQLVAVILAAVLGTAGCGAARPAEPLQPGAQAFPAPGGFNQFSVEQEIQVGKQAAAEADQQLPLLAEDHDVTQYVRRLANSLVTKLPENPYQFNFKVVNMKEINAFALPGGPIRINVGTLQASDNEAQLAGVIAHEIGHVYMRHATRNASKAMMAQIPAAILDGILGGGVGGQLARLGLSFGLGSVFLKYSRDAEREADQFGAKLLYEAGYDPHQMAEFFMKLDKEGGRGGPEFLQSHPNPGNRAEAVNVALSQLPKEQYRGNSTDFRHAKQVASNLKPKSAEEVAKLQQQRSTVPAGQISAGDIAPSQSFRTLNHSAFQIAYPENWQAFGDARSPVTIAPRAGVSENAIAYGVVISGYIPRQSNSLEGATQELVDYLRQANPDMQIAGRAQTVAVQGRKSYAINLIQPSPLTAGGQRLRERDLLVTIPRGDGSIIWLMFIAPEQHFDDLGPAFQEMLKSLRVG